MFLTCFQASEECTFMRLVDDFIHCNIKAYVLRFKPLTIALLASAILYQMNYRKACSRQKVVPDVHGVSSAVVSNVLACGKLPWIKRPFRQGADGRSVLGPKNRRTEDG